MAPIRTRDQMAPWLSLSVVTSRKSETQRIGNLISQCDASFFGSVLLSRRCKRMDVGARWTSSWQRRHNNRCHQLLHLAVDRIQICFGYFWASQITTQTTPFCSLDAS